MATVKFINVNLSYYEYDDDNSPFTKCDFDNVAEALRTKHPDAIIRIHDFRLAKDSEGNFIASVWRGTLYGYWKINPDFSNPRSIHRTLT
jgi:hypothetical protein